MAGLWRRFKLWVRGHVIRLVWRLVSSRLYRALRSLVSASLLPLANIATGALIGLAIAAYSGMYIQETLLPDLSWLWVKPLHV